MTNPKTMMPDFGATVTAAELLSLGINPDSPMSSRRDIINQPLDLRFGTNRIYRRLDGGITVSYGYYSAPQIEARAKEVKRFCEFMLDFKAGLVSDLRRGIP